MIFHEREHSKRDDRAQNEKIFTPANKQDDQALIEISSFKFKKLSLWGDE